MAFFSGWLGLAGWLNPSMSRGPYKLPRTKKSKPDKCPQTGRKWPCLWAMKRKAHHTCVASCISLLQVELVGEFVGESFLTGWFWLNWFQAQGPSKKGRARIALSIGGEPQSASHMRCKLHLLVASKTYQKQYKQWMQAKPSVWANRAPGWLVCLLLGFSGWLYEPLFPYLLYSYLKQGRHQAACMGCRVRCLAFFWMAGIGWLAGWSALAQPANASC